jgi:hypothetical protein
MNVIHPGTLVRDKINRKSYFILYQIGQIQTSQDGMPDSPVRNTWLAQEVGSNQQVALDAENSSQYEVVPLDWVQS